MLFSEFRALGHSILKIHTLCCFDFLDNGVRLQAVALDVTFSTVTRSRQSELIPCTALMGPFETHTHIHKHTFIHTHALRVKVCPNHLFDKFE